MTTTVADRCKRCGTKMRNGRSVCPCCGLDINGTTEMAASADTSGSHPIRKVAAKAGVKICPVCLESVPEEQLVDQEGQKLCPTCADNMRAKAAKKAAAAQQQK